MTRQFATRIGGIRAIPACWAVIWGGAKRMGGRGGNVPENALSRKFLDHSKRASGLLCRGFLNRKNRALTPEGGGKRTVGGGVQKPFLAGVSFVRFSTPLLFSTPPWCPLSLRFAMFSPRSAIRKKGFQFGSPQKRFARIKRFA